MPYAGVTHPAAGWSTPGRAQRSRGGGVRVLVVEDEAVLAAAIARGLRREGMAVDVSHDGAEALAKLDVNRYDVVVLDRDLPGTHGDEVCRTLAGQPSPTRILMLTAAGTVDDRVDGLTLGADDYLGKPFAFGELVARLRALARRRRDATRGGHFLRLTRKEFGVLETLLAADGAVVSAEDLLERVWDEHADPFTNTVRVTVMNLRRKLGRPPLIETVGGVGYRL